MVNETEMPLVTPCHSGPEVRVVLRRIRRILQQAADPRHWSAANQQEPAKVERWLKAVRYQTASRVNLLPVDQSWRRTARPVWLWMPLRPLHDRIQLPGKAVTSYLATYRLEQSPVVRSAFQELLLRESANEAVDLVDKVWRALRWIPQLEIVHWTDLPFLKHLPSLAFPFWTSVFPYELDWRPVWCALCGFPVRPYAKGDILWQDKLICLPCAQHHGATVFRAYANQAGRCLPSELRPERWGWIACSHTFDTSSRYCHQRSLGGWLQHWKIPEEHKNAD